MLIQHFNTFGILNYNVFPIWSTYKRVIQRANEEIKAKLPVIHTITKQLSSMFFFNCFSCMCAKFKRQMFCQRITRMFLGQYMLRALVGICRIKHQQSCNFGCCNFMIMFSTHCRNQLIFVVYTTHVLLASPSLNVSIHF